MCTRLKEQTHRADQEHSDVIDISRQESPIPPTPIPPVVRLRIASAAVEYDASVDTELLW